MPPTRRRAGIPASLVAPIFRHGAGHGSFGCKAVNPPVFLSEDEARQVIIEEGETGGLSFTLDGQGAEEGRPSRSPRHFPRPIMPKKPESRNRPAHPGRRMTVRGSFGFEVVSGDDFKQ